MSLKRVFASDSLQTLLSCLLGAPPRLCFLTSASPTIFDTNTPGHQPDRFGAGRMITRLSAFVLSPGFPRGRGVRSRPDRRGERPDVGRDHVRGKQGQGRQERQGGDPGRRGGELERSGRLHSGRLEPRVSSFGLSRIRLLRMYFVHVYSGVV